MKRWRHVPAAASAASAGVTLIELLVALVVVGILVVVAIPGYRSHVLRVQRTDATAALARAQSAQERHYLDHHRYAGSLTDAPPAGLGLRGTSDAGYYRLSVETSEDGSGFTVTATPVARAGAGDDRCQALTLDAEGRHRARDAAGRDTTGECWR